MTAKRILMAPMVGTMGWMTRYMGPVARPIIRWVADREIIACGLRAGDGTARIIYSPQTGEGDYRIVRRGSSGWVTAESASAADFAPGLVRQVIAPTASVDDRYRVIGRRPDGRTLSSPVIRIKPETRRPSTLAVCFDQTGGAQICWPKPEGSAAMLYFLTIQKMGDPALVGVYTRERCWRYPMLSTASLTIGGTDPPRLLPDSEYVIQIVAVDYDGWVQTLSTWNGVADSQSHG